jgi:micrococcal nuclease
MSWQSNNLTAVATALVAAMVLVLGFRLDPVGFVISEQGADTDKPATARATVTRVVDGDTIRVRTASGSDTVRLIGVDTPEIKWPSEDNNLDKPKSEDCYALEAREYLQEAVKGRQVQLQSDSTQPLRDTYDRRLAYVFVDNELINQSLIAEGYGRELTVNGGYEKQASFQDAENSAREQQQGLWGNCDEKNP